MVSNSGPPPAKCATTPAVSAAPLLSGHAPGTPATHRVALTCSPPSWPGWRTRGKGRPREAHPGGCREGRSWPASASPRGRRGPGRDTRQSKGCARGRARSHVPALTGIGGGAASRPQTPESPQAGGNGPVTTEAPRTRHKPLPGPPGKGQGTTRLRARGGCACAQVLLRSRGSPLCQEFVGWWEGSQPCPLPGDSRERELFSVVYLLLFKRL